MLPFRHLVRRYAVEVSKNIAANGGSPKIPTPRALKSILDEYIIGQDIGKKVISVAVYNHYLRVNDKEEKLKKKTMYEFIQKENERTEEELEQLKGQKPTTEVVAGMNSLKMQLAKSRNAMDNEDNNLELSKSNLLILGPTGSGKTLLASTLARSLDVPIAITDCTQLTQAGYIGEDVEICIERLLVNAGYDEKKAERGIIVLDEVDKLAKRSSDGNVKDVSGEGVQQSLLKILEGHRMELTLQRPAKVPDANNKMTTELRPHTFTVDTSNILFILTGAFVGLDDIISKRIESMKSFNNKKNHSNKEKKAKKEKKSSPPKASISEIELSPGQKVSPLSVASPIDLITFGLIPELVGRVPIVTALEPLKANDLFKILKEPKNAVLHQYQYIFKQFNVHLCITKNALLKIADIALKENTGARGLRSIMERLLLNINYECPDSNVKYVLINEDTVKSLVNSEYSLAPCIDVKYYTSEEKDAFLGNIKQEDPDLFQAMEESLIEESK